MKKLIVIKLIYSLCYQIQKLFYVSNIGNYFLDNNQITAYMMKHSQLVLFIYIYLLNQLKNYLCKLF